MNSIYSRWRSLALFAGAALALAPAAARAEIQVLVNDRPVAFPYVQPMKTEGRVLIPLRAVSESLGARVAWDADTATVSGRKEGHRFSLRIDSREATVDGRSVSLDVPAMLTRGTTMVPLRFVAEALGADVRWNEAEQLVAIRLDSAGEPPQARRPDRHAPPEARRPERPAPPEVRRPEPPISAIVRVPPVDRRLVTGQVVAVRDRTEPRTITIRVAGERQEFRVGRDTLITRGIAGDRTAEMPLRDLQPGENVRVRVDPDGHMAHTIEALDRKRGGPAPARTSEVVGEVTDVHAQGNRWTVSIRTAEGRAMYTVAPDAVILRTPGERSGHPLDANSLHEGDAVRIVLDSQGRAQRIMALPRPAPPHR